MSHWLSAVLSSPLTMSSALFVRKQSILLMSSRFHFLLALAAQAYALKEENDSLRWQLDAYRNEVELLKQEKGQLFRTEESLTKDQQLQFLQQTMQGMQQVLLRKKRTGLFLGKWYRGAVLYLRLLVMKVLISFQSQNFTDFRWGKGEEKSGTYLGIVILGIHQL